MRKRRQHNHVHRIKDAEGSWHENPKDVEGAFLKYYEQLLGSESDATGHVSNSVMVEGPRVGADLQQLLITPFTSEEVKSAMFDIDENRVACPDGYSSGFFKKAWLYVGQEVTAVVLDFFKTAQLLKKTNATNLRLIPKVEQPEEVSLSDLLPAVMSFTR